MRIYDKIAYRLFGRFADRRVKNYPQIETTLLMAEMFIRAEYYVARIYFSCFLAGIITSLSSLLLFFLLPENMKARLVPILVAFPMITITFVYAFGYFYPENKARERARNIELQLPYALSFMAALASAGVTPVGLFRALANQKSAYESISSEASKIYTDVTLYGMDIITALKNSAERSPSARYREVIQGIISTITAGGSLKEYLFREAQELMRENRTKMKSFFETLSVLAESYVVLGVAFPLFMMILFSVMLLIQTSGLVLSIQVLYVIIFIVLPVISIAYAILLKISMPGV
ncbi:hypothetical protein Asulf_00247 [Archaeoglobus sulfaticallidus PM70-1]|uniref:Type II secretion system protein GspF domain-containing protein n=1 Tax=Archaeoglobus sulfaticallidus PM70-1 TaxID=387631 RepID=N0BJE6_9EURY|nr:type II secretion system F family protein [Archaeoglobus sulfaticallidus]AGK60280.1 hypothetical protein Asulf_00247 [Archaeoglobus sulfaticallidus PM70-1]